MAANTFDRKNKIVLIVLIDRGIRVMASDAPEKTLTTHPYTSFEREKIDSLLKECISRSEN